MNPDQTTSKDADQTAVFVLLRFACWAIIYDFVGCLFVFKIDFLQKKILQEYYQSVKLFEYRSGPTFCLS